MNIEVYRSNYFNLQGYLACIVKYKDGTRKTVLKHREVMENYLGRSLSSKEIIHHKNGDKKDNTVDNLEIVNASAHLSYHAKLRGIEYVELTCINCGKLFKKQAKEERGRIKRKCNGPLCSRKCSGEYIRRNQIECGKVNLWKVNKHIKD